MYNFSIYFSGTLAWAEKPSFDWLETKSSASGVPLLKVHFPDGNRADYIHLKQFNPIPKQPNERLEDVDPCIFEGFLENEPDVYAVLTGGCPLNSSFEVFVVVHLVYLIYLNPT